MTSEVAMAQTLALPDLVARRLTWADISAYEWATRSDEQLVALFRGGHHRAFEMLAERYRERLLSLCRHMLKSQEDGEDALQDVLVAAFNAIRSTDRAIHVQPWLYRIATNRCINQLRRAKTIAFTPLDDESVSNTRPVFEQLVGREELRQLVCDIRTLPARQRSALLLCEIDGLTYDEIAIAMTATVPAVKSLLVRARFGLHEAAANRSAPISLCHERVAVARPEHEQLDLDVGADVMVRDEREHVAAR
jgi:RNA polymerase sigma factor (sigma-70 family)